MTIVQSGAEYVSDEYSDEYYERRSTTSATTIMKSDADECHEWFDVMDDEGHDDMEDLLRILMQCV